MRWARSSVAFALSVVFCIHQLVSGAIQSDEITSLPGWTQPLPSKQYGGYLSAEGGQSQLFYLFVESENDPSTDPIILWLNGGPGCSSLLGYFTEHGPFEPVTGNTLQLRDYRWSRLANILYLESPVGVGFTYSTTNNFLNNDTRSVQLNYDALVSFFAGFPEYASNDFYIAGESYAGIYIPTLANQLLTAGTSFPGPTLLGIMVGNGCTGTDAQTTCAVGSYCSGEDCAENALMPGYCAGLALRGEYLSQVPVAPDNIRHKVTSACNWTAAYSASATPENLCQWSSLCWEAQVAMYDHFLAIDFYDVYGSCSNPNFTSTDSTSCWQQGNPVLEQAQVLSTLQRSFNTMHNLNDNQGNPRDVSLPELLKQSHEAFSKSRRQQYRKNAANLQLRSFDDDDTGDTFYTEAWLQLGAPAFCLSETPALPEYVNSDAFMAAVHAIAPVGYCWGACNTAPAFTYVRTEADTVTTIYPTLVTKLKVLIYNGDFDAVVPYLDNYRWTHSLAATLSLPVARNWSAWQYTDRTDNSTQVAGFSVKWDVSQIATTSTAGFQFRTVRGAGHTVPQDTPDKAFQLFAHFIGKGSEHYYYPQSCSSSDSSSTSSSGSSNNNNNKGLTGNPIGITFVVLTLILFAVVVYLLIERSQRGPTSSANTATAATTAATSSPFNHHTVEMRRSSAQSTGTTTDKSVPSAPPSAV